MSGAETPGTRRTERLLRLIASLLDAKEPVPAETICGWFPEYGDVAQDAFERKFERDKAVLHDLGMPLRYVYGEDGNPDGYVIAPEEAFLPELGFDQDELAALTLAGQAVLSQREFPYHRDLSRALDTIALAVDPASLAAARGSARRILYNHPAQPPEPRLRDLLERISDALTARRRLRLVYHALSTGEISERVIDPYGLRCWRGRWAVVAYYHDREDIRLFSLHRIRELGVPAHASEPPDFDVPADFSLAAWQKTPPWRFTAHAPTLVEFDIERDRAWLAEQQLGISSREETGDWSRFSLEVTHLQGFVEWALRQGPSLRVLAPDEARAAVKSALEGVLASCQREEG